MLSKVLLLVGLSLAVLCPGIATAKEQGLFNTPKHEGKHTYWVYRTRVTNTGDTANTARVLQIGTLVSIPRILKARFYRYAPPGASDKNYKAQKFGNHKFLDMIGKYDDPDDLSPYQRRTTFKLVGEYREEGKDFVLVIRGFLYPGPDTDPVTSHGDGSRADDRVVMRVVYEGEKSGAPTLPSIVRIAELLDKGDDREEAQKLIQTLIEVYLKSITTDPCDQQPDDDVMEEEALNEDAGTEVPDLDVPEEP